MSHRMASEIAEALGGEAVPEADGECRGESWVVRIARGDGRIVVISDSSVDEFPDDDARAAGHCYLSIALG